MLNTIYANRVNEKDIDFENKDIRFYYYRNSKNKLVAIVSYGALSLEDTIILYTASNHRFIGYLDWAYDMPQKNEKVIYYVCG